MDPRAAFANRCSWPRSRRRSAATSTSRTRYRIYPLTFGKVSLPDFLTAHDKCTANRRDVAASHSCGCFYCLSEFGPSEVVDWVPDDEGDTAVCPRCGIDSVLGSASGYPVTPMFLHEMHEYWFGPGPSLIILTGVVKEVDDACRVHLVAVDEGDSEVGAARDPDRRRFQEVARCCCAVGSGGFLGEA